MVGLASPSEGAEGQNVLWLHCSLIQAVSIHGVNHPLQALVINMSFSRPPCAPRKFSEELPCLVLSHLLGCAHDVPSELLSRDKIR